MIYWSHNSTEQKRSLQGGTKKDQDYPWDEIKDSHQKDPCDVAEVSTHSARISKTFSLSSSFFSSDKPFPRYSAATLFSSPRKEPSFFSEV